MNQGIVFKVGESHVLLLPMLLKSNKVIILSILLLGVLLRIYDLDRQSISGVEAFSIWLAEQDLYQIVLITSRDVHPPLYYIILHYWIDLFGDSEVSSRFLSAAFGILAIFVMYKVGDLVFKESVGILSSLILALSVFHIQFSQQARMYSLMSLLTLCSFYFFIQMFKRGTLTDSIGYLTATILLAYSHYYGLFIILVQNIYLLTIFIFFRDRSAEGNINFRRWVLLEFILLIMYIPWMRILITQILKVESGLYTSEFWLQVPTIHTIFHSFIEYSGSQSLFCLFLILVPFSIVTFSRNEIGISRKDLWKFSDSYSLNVTISNVNRISLLLLWLWTPIILPFIISQFAASIYITRGSIVASLPFYMLVANGIETINKSRSINLILASLIIIFSLISVSRYYNTVTKEQWKEIASYIDANEKQGDLVLFHSGFSLGPFNYYSKSTDLNKKLLKKDDNVGEMRSTTDGYNRIWLLVPSSVRAPALMDGYLNTIIKSYNLLYQKEFVGVDLYLFQER